MNDSNEFPNFFAFPQWTADDFAGDPQHSRFYVDDADHQAAYAMSATHNVDNDLEDVLNFVWTEDDTASRPQFATEMASPRVQQAGSVEDQLHSHPIMDFDWLSPGGSYGFNNASAYGDPELYNEEASGEGLLELEASWKQEEESGAASSWIKAGYCWEGGSRSAGGCEEQGLLQGDGRASWDDGLSNASCWQGGMESAWEGRGNWQVAGRRPASAAAGGASDGGSGVAPACSPSYAGPTLMDIESALAMTDQSTTGPFTSCSAAGSRHMLGSPSNDLEALLAQGDTYTPELDSYGCAWRQKLQKRISQEPKSTIKVETKEKALGDGYRWRKYGQKSIKNSPFPRSYYRCSTNKCNAKKQVERCPEDGQFLVTYEGIHLHHKPVLLQRLCIEDE